MSSASVTPASPQVSVVVPVHNGAAWLKPTLDALYAQSFADFEIVLVDDASTDALQAAVRACPDPRLRVVHLAHNVGVSAARNHGLALARGALIAFCDADDLSMPQRLQTQVDYLAAHPEIALCGSAFTCFDTEDRALVQHPSGPARIRKALMQGNCFGLSTVMLRAHALQGLRFDETLRVAEDYDLWTRLAASGAQLDNLQQSLLRYRWHSQQASRAHSERLDAATRKIRAVYCSHWLDDTILQAQLRADAIDPSTLARAAQALQRFCAHAAPDAPQLHDFRFLLAWIYERQGTHGVRAWLHWRALQRQLGLQLDRNYRLNTGLLAWLPSRWTARHLDTLVKLKR